MKLYSFLKYIILWLCVTFYLVLVSVPMRELFIVIFFPPFLLIFLFMFSIQGFFLSLIIIAVYYGIKRLWLARANLLPNRQ